ncbi:hypothetical protein DICPUDRAFT_35951 [Dictyostelium purpureum]|uniref:EGF-like domain-containing protein n=1 Tax=Dictyostelium purpureum TaxID=5786 RepID=F0ZQ66_DICPU|nr:uncharacterized protein DICPUDRAFT_35951 [Dictyostelium purpureum]EGC33916.1 hypothetical protein DICPUDRAFT_35951 [Dictyostelium purpureum]|eukprot:XP_003289551.1 hypothetical protein DICPUDRAFT_35951 [Dictyostelium purpureum]
MVVNIHVSTPDSTLSTQITIDFPTNPDTINTQPVLYCQSNCSKNGFCVTNNATCSCFSKWTGSECSLPIQSISSIDPCTSSGGQVIIHGWFGDVHEDPSITIGNLPCSSPQFTSDTIVCQLGGGDGTKDVVITQNGVQVVFKNRFQYLNYNYPCLNDCTSPLHGTCNTTIGSCICKDSWTGFDCSLKSSNDTNGNNIPGSNSTVDTDTGETSISNENTNYLVGLIELVEIDVNGNEAKRTDLQSNWNATVKNSIYKFSKSYENLFNIVYTVEQIKEQLKEYTYAGIKLSIPKGGIKISVNITNYQYQSSLNTLQLRFLSTVKESDLNDCNNEESKSTTNIDPNLTLNYISIKKNKRIFSGRFINRIESDGRATFMSSEIVSSNSTSVIVGLNLPFCKTCYIDPDFSVLVSPDFKACNKSREKWIIPVAVVVPCVGVALIIIIIVLLYKNYKYSIKEKLDFKLRVFNKE